MTELTDETVKALLDDDHIKFFADRLLEVARIKAATEPYEGECDQEDLASYAGEVVKLRRALLDTRAELDRVKVAALAEVKALVVERAAKQLAAARETFCYASPGSDEDFTSLLLGFDTAAGIIRAITTDPELKTQIAHQTQKLSPM